MQRSLPTLRNLFRSVLLLSALTAASAQAAEKIDLIIDTDPGADDVVALLFAMASPEELNIRALTTVAGNVRLDKTSRNARLAREWAGRDDIPVYAGAPKPLLRTPIYAENIHGKEGISGVTVHEPKKGLAEGNAVDYLIKTLSTAKPHRHSSARYSRNTRPITGVHTTPSAIKNRPASANRQLHYFRRAKRSVNRSKKPWASPFSTQNTFFSCFRPSYQSTMVWPKVGPSRLSTTILA